MKKTISLLLLIFALTPLSFSQSNTGANQMKAFQDIDGDVNILEWNSNTGESTLYAFYTHQSYGTGFHKFNYQLPQKHYTAGSTQMDAFIDRDGDINILVWNSETGESTLYAFYKHETAGTGFHKFNYQLPQKHYSTGDTQMSAFKDKDGDINILVSNSNTGKSTLYAFYKHETAGNGFHKFNYQLPQN